MRISDRSSDVCSSDLFDGLGRTLTTVHANVNVNKTLRRILEQKAETFRSGEGFEWATGEALAFGGLLSEGYGVRLTGQDSGRGTFRQRHSDWVDQDKDDTYNQIERTSRREQEAKAWKK